MRNRRYYLKIQALLEYSLFTVIDCLLLEDLMHYYLLSFDEVGVIYINLFVDFHSAELFDFTKPLISFMLASKGLEFVEAILKF